MNLLAKILVVICSLLFLMIGLDKFLAFLEPPCSLEEYVSPIIWKAFGVLQIVSAVLIWSSKFRRYVTGFFAVFMLVFTMVHLSESTYDIGGAASMAVILGLLNWNPGFLQAKG